MDTVKRECGTLVSTGLFNVPKMIVRDLSPSNLDKAKDVKNYIYDVYSNRFKKRKRGDPRETTDDLEWGTYIIENGAYKINPTTGWYVRNTRSMISFAGVTDEERLIIVEKRF